MNWIIAHWGSKKREVFKAITDTLGGEGHRFTWVRRDTASGYRELESLVKGGRHDGVLTWQRFYQMSPEMAATITGGKIKCVVMDFGFVPHYSTVVFDSQGDNAESRLRQRAEGNLLVEPSAAEYSKLQELSQQILDSVQVFNKEWPPLLSSVRSPFLFVPLQRPEDAVVQIDSKVRDLGALVRRVLTLARHKYFVVVKTHPLDRDIELGVPDKVAGGHVVVRTGFDDDNERLGDLLLSQAAVVIGVNSNMLFRAMVLGRPVVAVGRGWYSGSRALHEVDGIAGLTELRTLRIDQVARVKFLCACLSRQLTYQQLRDPEALLPLLKRVVNE